MDLSFYQSEKGFSLDELVVKLADVFECKAFSELLKMMTLGPNVSLMIYPQIRVKPHQIRCQPCFPGNFS